MTNSIETLTDLDGPRYIEIATELSEDVKYSSKTVLDIVYGNHQRQKLDIYLPNSSTRLLPVLMFMHGGYWTLGSKDFMGFMAPAITILPAIFISVGYQLTPEAKFPQPLEDCRMALKWVFENISEYGGNPNNISIGGHSAGGHIAAMVALENDKLTKIGLPSDAIKNCFPVSAIYDVVDTRPDRRDIFVSSLDEAREASPLNHLEGNSTPFLLAIGENDFPMLRPQFFKMVEGLQAEGNVVETLDMQGFNHFQISLDNGTLDGPWATKVREWLAGKR